MKKNVRYLTILAICIYVLYSINTYYLPIIDSQTNLEILFMLFIATGFGGIGIATCIKGINHNIKRKKLRKQEETKGGEKMTEENKEIPIAEQDKSKPELKPEKKVEEKPQEVKKEEKKKPKDQIEESRKLEKDISKGLPD